MRTRITGSENSCYHVFSRIVERRFYLGRIEKEAFKSLLWRVAEFSGVKILTYCILDNHFHILVQIPERVSVDDDELLCRLKTLYGIGPRKGPYDPVREFERSKDNPGLRSSLRKKYLRRMYDLSEFMRTLKLRYSFWFNRTHNRMGSLWDMRFKSVLVEGTAQRTGNQALVAVAAYIDLNCVRAGIVKHPGEYRWRGYAEAMAGGRTIRNGFSVIYGLAPADVALEWSEIEIMYRTVLCISQNEQQMNYSMITGAALLRNRIRYFTQGAVLGSRLFVNEAFEKHRWMFGAKRTTGARKMRGGKWGELYVARQVGM